MATDTRDTAGAGARYIGRQRELASIDDALSDALAGRGRIVLVSGEPGIGKSRLLTEVERRACGRGVPVAWGRSPEAEGAPPYWPWRQVLRALQTRDTASESSLSAPPSRLHRIDPGLAPAGDAPDDQGGGELRGAERFGAFDAVADVLRAAASHAGLVVLLDDMHWADAPSLRLLEHVALEWAGSRGLLIAAHRPVGSDRDAPLRRTLAQLARVEGATRIALEGFTAEETAARLSDVTGRAFAADAVAVLQRRTSGNPFFIGEFGQLLATAEARDLDAERAVPSSVRDVIARRVSELPRGVQDILEVAAVAGAQPSPGIVAAVLDIPVAGVLERFDEATAAGLLAHNAETNMYTFSHALLRDALYTEMPPARRVQMHALVATRLEQLAGTDRASRLSELAYHWLQALPGGYADAAARSAAAAADAAMSQLAYEEAARLYEAASRASTETADSGREAHLLLGAARAHFFGGEVDRSAELCEDVARRARATGDAAMLADAALVLERVGDRQLSALIAGLCEEAIAALPGDALQTRSRLQAQLTNALVYLDDYERIERLSREALDGAERSGDDDTLAAALHARHTACSDVDGLAERLVVTERLLEVAIRSRRVVDELWARLWRFDSAMQRGMVADCEREIASIEVLAARIKQPLVNWHLERCRFVVAQVRGDFDAARRAADDGDRFARSAGELARRRRPMQYLIVSVSTGDEVEDVAPAIDPGSATGQHKPVPQTAMLIARETMALAALFRGDTERAGAIYDTLPGPDRWLVMPPARFIANAHRAVIAALLGRRDDCAAMYAQLQPYADLFVTAGAGSVACFGSAELNLGLLARTLGRNDAAVKHLERAVERNDHVGMRPAAAESRYQLALTLQQRGRSGDVAVALPVVTASLESAQRLRMRPLVARAATLREALRAGTRQSRVLTPREMEIARMVAEGLTSREIAEAMHISSRTADNHVQHILDKLALRSRSQIATWVAQRR